jgi:hypothetical protein
MIFKKPEPRLPPAFKPKIPREATLTSRGACSDCHVPAVVAAGGDMKICPKCYSVLWRRDYAAEQRRQKLQAEKLAAEAARVRRAEREAQARLDRDHRELSPPITETKE